MKGGVTLIGNMQGDAGSQSGTVTGVRATAGVRRNRFSNNWAQVMSHSPGPTMNRQNSRHEPRRRNLVNAQQPGKEIRPEIFSGHVAQTKDPHEQVTSTKTAEQGTEEPAGHSPGHQ
jgi:hypothetical protein